MVVVPHVGIGKVRLGMSEGEAERLRDKWMRTDVDGSPPIVAFIQVSHSTVATYRGLDLFDEPADEVVSALAEMEGLDPADYPPGKHSYLFPALNLLLWRGEVSDEPDTQGHTFQAVSLFTPDYYQGAALEQIRRETTHRKR